jgi:LacI family transcriptional regulator
MAAHDALARKLVEECQENDITVPDKAAVVSGDDTDLYSQAGTLPLTSVPSLGEAVGREAARLLDEWLERGRRPPDRTLIPPAPVVVRESTLMMVGLDPATGAALHHLRQHAVEGINVEDVVRACGLCRRTFDRALVNILGRTAHAEIERIRLERSEVLLRTTTLSVNTVARRSGFSSGNYFRTVFKKHYRMTASEFRSRNGQSRAA